MASRGASNTSAKGRVQVEGVDGGGAGKLRSYKQVFFSPHFGEGCLGKASSSESSRNPDFSDEMHEQNQRRSIGLLIYVYVWIYIITYIYMTSWHDMMNISYMLYVKHSFFFHWGFSKQRAKTRHFFSLVVGQGHPTLDYPRCRIPEMVSDSKRNWANIWKKKRSMWCSIAWVPRSLTKKALMKNNLGNIFGVKNWCFFFLGGRVEILKRTSEILKRNRKDLINIFHDQFV